MCVINTPTEAGLQSVGVASGCLRSGVDQEHTVKCGGRSFSCLATGSGPGNDAACGGAAAYCVSILLDLSLSISSDSYAVACGGDRFSKD